MSTYIIAEAGSNHNKNLDQAYALVDAASDAGVTAVKFQIFSSHKLYSKNTPNFATYENINQLVKNLELPREWVEPIKNYCDGKGIEFMASPFDESAVQQLVDIGSKRIKIAGFESTDLRFVDMVASAQLPLIISAGIGCGIEKIDDILKTCHRHAVEDITILHCNNAYPTPQKDINLMTMVKIKERYGSEIQVGLSDHTESTLTPALAVAMGATTIEKHFTLSKRLPGPDHSFAMNPSELKEMVDNIKVATISRGEKSNLHTASESSFSPARRSVVAITDIQQGDMLDASKITTRRPFLENSIPADKFYEVVGKKATKNIRKDFCVLKDEVV